jgi:AcrR family transcriptional regulator
MAVSARERIIRTAHDLFYRVGFHAVGLDGILAEVGITKTTFYNHFKSKDDLVQEVLEMHDRWWQDTFREMLRKFGGDKPLDQLRAVPKVLEWMFGQREFNGCFFVNVAVQFPLPHDPAHEAAATHKRSMESIIRELAGYAGADDPTAFAQELSLLMEGAYVTRQVTGDPNTAKVAGRLVEMLIENHWPDVNA